MTILPKLMQGLRERGADDIIVVAGGVIPDADVSSLLKMGVAKVLSQDTPVDAIPDELRKLVQARGQNV
jgi:methylmalonyl-CoA mutase cobalamin-binding domain/chain